MLRKNSTKFALTSNQTPGMRLTLLFTFLLMVCSARAQFYSDVVADTIFTFKDKRDNNKYTAVKIGDMIWMGENLRYKTKDSWCYKDKELNCEKFGRLYEWEEAQTACPPGWHLPSMAEFDSLVARLGGDKKAGYALAYDSGVGMQMKFGYPPNVNGRFNAEDSQTNFWTSSENNKDTAWSYYMIKIKLPLVFSSYFSKNYNMSCRCVKDDSEIGG
ncbi:MAG TPA: hypothetical protein DCG24_07055 [Bacteroidetes bacterium]|nr:hypothetical protein [Bacteroidota bacterium]HAE35696.1 hypothetical protein [Bacteroidota bacterium]